MKREYEHKIVLIIQVCNLSEFVRRMLAHMASDQSLANIPIF